MAAPPLGPELEAVARSHRAARRQLRVLVTVNRGLTALAVVILLVFLTSLYGRVRVMYHPDQFEGPLQEEAQILLPKLEPELRALWSETAPVYGDLAREKLEESLPRVLETSQDELGALLAGLQAHATERVDHALHRVARRHDQRLRAEFPDLCGGDLFGGETCAWTESVDADFDAVRSHYNARYAQDLEDLQATLDRFRAPEHEGLSRDELTRQFIHLWLMKVDRWVLLADEGEPLEKEGDDVG